MPPTLQTVFDCSHRHWYQLSFMIYSLAHHLQIRLYFVQVSIRMSWLSNYPPFQSTLVRFLAELIGLNLCHNRVLFLEVRRNIDRDVFSPQQ